MNGSITANFNETVEKTDKIKSEIIEKGVNNDDNEENINNNEEEIVEIQEEDTQLMKESFACKNETPNNNVIDPVIKIIHKSTIKLKLNYIAETNLGSNSSKAMLLMLLKK